MEFSPLNFGKEIAFALEEPEASRVTALFDGLEDDEARGPDPFVDTLDPLFGRPKRG